MFILPPQPPAGPAQLPVSEMSSVGVGSPTSDTSMYATPDTSMHHHNNSTISSADLPLTPSDSQTLSRASSISSLSSEPALFSPGNFPPRQYALPSDVESEVEDSHVSLNSVSKDMLYQSFLKVQKRSERYKAKFGQLMNAYREVEREREKLKVSVINSFLIRIH